MEVKDKAPNQADDFHIHMEKQRLLKSLEKYSMMHRYSMETPIQDLRIDLEYAQRREFYEMRNKKYAEDNSRFKCLMEDQQSMDNLNMDSKDSKDIYTYNFHKKCITKINGCLYREYFLDDGTPISPECFKDPAMRKVATCVYNGWVVSGKPVEKRE